MSKNIFFDFLKKNMKNQKFRYAFRKFSKKNQRAIWFSKELLKPSFRARNRFKAVSERFRQFENTKPSAQISVKKSAMIKKIIINYFQNFLEFAKCCPTLGTTTISRFTHTGRESESVSSGWKLCLHDDIDKFQCWGDSLAAPLTAAWG